MAKIKKTNGSITVKGDDGKITGNIAADALAGPQYGCAPVSIAPVGAARGLSGPIDFPLIEMTLDEWTDKFTFIESPEGSNLWDEVPAGFDVHNIWTQVDGDEGQICVSEGIHFVNRNGYYLTEETWGDNVAYNIVAELWRC
jgi:hypothetical protein